MPQTYLLKELSRYSIGTWADVIYRNALLFPDREAFVHKTSRVTFSAFNARVNSLAHGLRSMDVKKGDTVGVLSWNCLECADLFGAAAKGRFILSPFSPRLQAKELDYLINYSEVAVLFVGPEMMEIIDSLRPNLSRIKHYVALEASGRMREPYIDYGRLLASHPTSEPDVMPEEQDPCIIYYTSGTSGMPRGALCSQRQRMEDTRVKALQLRTKAGDRHLLITPLFHIGGSGTCWMYFYVGGCNIMTHERVFDPSATMSAIQQEKATDVFIVPTQLVSILALTNLETYDISSLKRIWYAASPMPTELLRRGVETFGPIFMQCYGQSESGPDITFLSCEDHDVLDGSVEEQKRLLSCGRPCLGTHVRIVDEHGHDLPRGMIGEIVVRSERIMMGYWRRPEDTKSVLLDGWLHTGDMGYYDERGYIYIADRKKDMIVSGGENIFPREVEEVLYQHPAVLEAAVIGIPDPYWVERAHAVVALRENMDASEPELVEFCKERMARFKAPKSVEFVDVLPKNASGKIMKRELRERYWQGKERRVCTRDAAYERPI